MDISISIRILRSRSTRRRAGAAQNARTFDDASVLRLERPTDAAFDQEGGARLAADDDFPAVELQPRQKQQVALDWASEREAAVVKSLAL